MLSLTLRFIICEIIISFFILVIILKHVVKTWQIYFSAFQKDYSEPTKIIPPRPPREQTVDRAATLERTIPVDPWRLLPEQKKYYVDEFLKLPKDEPGYYVSGNISRDFFTKSKLPNDELIHIWELADLDKDGKLTKLEFCIAFHLTVARRNGFPLPTQIPESLYNGLAGIFFLRNLGFL